jgi:hypothetical protein
MHAHINNTDTLPPCKKQQQSVCCRVAAGPKTEEEEREKNCCSSTGFKTNDIGSIWPTEPSRREEKGLQPDLVGSAAKHQLFCFLWLQQLQKESHLGPTSVGMNMNHVIVTVSSALASINFESFK